MGFIFYVMGKSSTGKDTIYKRLLQTSELGLRRILPYTTRPKREGEKEGEDYYFVSVENLNRFEKEGRLIERRTYHTIHGDWIYATIDSEEINLKCGHYLAIGTPESYISMKNYFGADVMIPLYIEVEDGQRLKRALEREMKQEKPRYQEMCRRFLADEEDFAEEKLVQAGITERFENRNQDSCYQEIKSRISACLKEE